MPVFTTWDAVEWVLLIPIILGSTYAILSTGAILFYFRRLGSSTHERPRILPPVTVLKPVCGLEKNLKANLRSICLQDYPEYQVILCAQHPEDPAVPALREIQREFGPAHVSVVIKDAKYGSNGKVNNLLGGLTEARHEVLVISDSDVLVQPDYLRTMVSTLSSPHVGAVCSLARASKAARWFEKLELLTINADFMPSVIFAHMTGAAKFCLGWSVALRRSTLKAIGGLESLADYLVEDYELGRRVWASGQRVALAPQVIDTVVDLSSVERFWSHQLYWDINLRLANPAGFFGTVFIRSVPFAILFAVYRLADPLGLAVLAAAVGVRLVTAAATLWWGLRDLEGLRSLFLLPLRDMVGLVSWVMAFLKGTVVWRDTEYRLTRGGKMVRLQTGHEWQP